MSMPEMVVTGSDFIHAFKEVQAECARISASKGWDEQKRDPAVSCMLIVTEVAECVEGLRHGNPPSEHIPEFKASEEELADVVIRCMTLANSQGWRLAEAIEAKMIFNEGRSYRHGGKAF